MKEKIYYYKYWLRKPKIPKRILQEFKIDCENFKNNKNENKTNTFATY